MSTFNIALFEDSLQYQCAIQNGCDFLLAFNTKDFKNNDKHGMRVMTPGDFLSYHAQS